MPSEAYILGICSHYPRVTSKKYFNIFCIFLYKCQCFVFVTFYKAFTSRRAPWLMQVTSLMATGLLQVYRPSKACVGWSTKIFKKQIFSYF